MKLLKSLPFVISLVLLLGGMACNDSGAEPHDPPRTPTGSGNEPKAPGNNNNNNNSDNDNDNDNDDGDAGEAPASWTCEAASYGGDSCDCGCGAVDPGCGGDGCTEAGCFASACTTCTDASGQAMECLDPDAVWTCPEEYIGDGDCDCGCGIPDPDCGGAGCHGNGCSAPACEFCWADGMWIACDDNGGGAGGIPAEWTCLAEIYADGVCDCGCGAPDPDCGGMGCTTPNCYLTACAFCTDGTNFIECKPEGWTCSAGDYQDGNKCHCGCGIADPDCDAAGCTEPGCLETACNYCLSAGGTPVSCAGEVPDEWTCNPMYYGDGTCHCGCGVKDIDCIEDDDEGAPVEICDEPGCWAASCERCMDNSDFEGACLEPAPENWTCSRSMYFDNACDCGCSEKDPACGGDGCTEPGCRADSCQTCRDGSGGWTSCATPPADPGWTCSDSKWNNTACDCGCGIKDPACDGLGCSEPACQADACATTTPPAEYTCSDSWYSDSICDCGCGAPDPGCGDAGCTEPGCNEAACQFCVAENGSWSSCGN